MSPTKILTTILVLVTIASTRTLAQCRTPLPFTACTGTEPLVVADEIIPEGTTKWYYGPATTMNSLTLRGGTLVVCGDLTIDKFYMDSGQIMINPHARFVIGGGIGAGIQLFGKCTITNYGTFECQRNLSMDNGWASPSKPNIIINATWESSFKMPNQYFVINNANSYFVNNGFAQFWGLITDNQSVPGSVCLSGTMQMAVLINKIANSYITGSGNSCVYVHQFSQFSGVLTNSTNIYACLGASHTSSAGCAGPGCLPNNWGNAQVVMNCNTCSSLSVLPVRDRNTVAGLTRNEVTDVKIYPSPFVTDFYVEIPHSDVIEKIIVSDLTGKVIPVNYQKRGSKWWVSLNNVVQRQVLIVQIVTDKRVVTKKLLKE